MVAIGVQPGGVEKEPLRRTEKADTQFEMCYNRRALLLKGRTL